MIAGVVALVALAALPVVRVGSKSFTESYLLAEIAARVIEAAGEATVERKVGLGGTGVTHRALEHGDIDVYPEYAGTLANAVLKNPSLRTLDDLRAPLAARGLVLGEPLGFANTYALAMRREHARRLGIETISDLRPHPDLTAAFSSGFLERADGWPGLRDAYGLGLGDVRVVEHALAYTALTSGKTDVIDVFSTDGQLTRVDVTVLRDDRRFFPDYAAALVARRDVTERFPRTWARLQQTLGGRFDDRTMSRLNARVDLDGQSFAAVAAEFLGMRDSGNPRTALVHELARLTVDHAALVFASVLGAVAIGVPLGILAVRRPRMGQLELVGVGVLQTIPALALLCFMIPLFGIGKTPALVALFLYALLPIVRGVYTGLAGLDRQLLEMAGVLGLGPWQRLRRIELPLAALSIMAGIKTSAVLTVGTATLAAFIGGGGYGTLIVRGLAVNDVTTIMSGAIPAALMAVAIHVLFEGLDRLVIPHSLRAP
jgi:osmoprotectant transport system permease protein